MKMLKIDCSSNKAKVVHLINASQIIEIRTYDDEKHHDLNIYTTNGQCIAKRFNSTQELDDCVATIMTEI